MNAAVYQGIGSITVEVIETPHAGPGELVIQVKSCAICGGDLRTFCHGHSAIVPPIVLGHEVAGTIVEIGAGISQY